MPDADYFAKRASMERGMAERANLPEARDAHLGLAALHDAAAHGRPQFHEGSALILRMPPAG